MHMNRVLIVDDQPTFRTHLRQLLSLAGLSIVGEAASIHSAVALARQEQPDLVIMDVVMPGGSGFTGVPLLKQAVPGLRVILVSAHRDRARVFHEAALAAGAEAFISKDDLDLQLVKTWSQ
ncbi:MAG: response regulator transcription factor [Anaerolineales bacterium]|nr:response regulator transcription factor [Anaerolineales bacterium]